VGGVAWEGQVLRDQQRDGEVGGHTVAAAQRGDAEAFTAILRHYDRRMRVIASRLLDDRQAMDDVMQVAAMKALRGLPGYRGEAPLGAWLCRIVSRACLDELRRRGPAEALSIEDLQEQGSAGDAEDRLDVRDRVSRALAGLPPDQRVAVLLIDQFGYSFHEAASALDVPQGTVSSRVASARARLRAALSEGGAP
jgi:RNA polymerase sigma-70 factor (ECF subfamily)